MTLSDIGGKGAAQMAEMKEWHRAVRHRQTEGMPCCSGLPPPRAQEDSELRNTACGVRTQKPWDTRILTLDVLIAFICS